MFLSESASNNLSSTSKLREDAYLVTHIEELKEKMRILQNDRKANIEVLESNKQSNKEEIRRLRDENKEFRQRLAQLQRTVTQDYDKDEQKNLERQVEGYRRELDDMKLRTTRLQKVLDSEVDKARGLELDSQRPHMEDNEHTRRIRSLENKLDKAMIKYNEAQSIKKTYEQIVKRLQEERIGYDNQLSIMERTLHAKKRDFEELIVLSGDSLHAKELAGNELERVKTGYDEERKRREKELKERFNVIQLRKQMLNKLREREKLRLQLEEEYGRTTQEANEIAAKQLILQKLEQKNKIEIFENAFRKIKEATGVSDVNEVIQKIISQESTTESLIQLTHENQRKLEILLDEKKEAKQRVEEMKYNGLSGGIRRKLVDDSEDQLSNSQARLERNRARYDRLNKLIISVKAGIGHLQDKLYPIRYDDLIHDNNNDNSSGNNNNNTFTFHGEEMGMGQSQSPLLLPSSSGAITGVVAGNGVSAVVGVKMMMLGNGTNVSGISNKVLELNDDNLVEVLREQEQIITILHKKIKEGNEKKEIYRTSSFSNHGPATNTTNMNMNTNMNQSLSVGSQSEGLSSTSYYPSSDELAGNRPYNQRIDLPTATVDTIATLLSKKSYPRLLHNVEMMESNNNNNNNNNSSSGSGIINSRLPKSVLDMNMNSDSNTNINNSNNSSSLSYLASHEDNDDINAYITAHDGDEEISRDAVKKHSNQLLSAIDKKKKKQQVQHISRKNSSQGIESTSTKL